MRDKKKSRTLPRGTANTAGRSAAILPLSSILYVLSRDRLWLLYVMAVRSLVPITINLSLDGDIPNEVAAVTGSIRLRAGRRAADEDAQFQASIMYRPTVRPTSFRCSRVTSRSNLWLIDPQDVYE